MLSKSNFSRFMKLIKSLDQFGVHFQPSVRYSTSEYKTIQGAIFSILIYGLSCAYLIYVLIQWGNGGSLPKITTMQSVVNLYSLNYSEQYIEFELRKYSYTTIDPFNPNALILQLVAYQFIDGVPQESPILLNYTRKINKQNFSVIQLSNLSLSINQESTSNSTSNQLLLIIGECVDIFLREGQKCADEITRNQFFTQNTNAVTATVFSKEFNTQSEKLEEIQKEYLLPILNQSTYYAQASVKITQAQVDTGFLFASTTQYQFISEQQIVGLSVDTTYFINILKYQTYAAFYYTINNQQSLQTISYPKISEALAEAGSITSTLLLCSFFIIVMNKNFLSEEAFNSIIQIYYPDFKQIKITKNFFGSIIKVEKNGKIIDLKAFQPYYEHLKKVAEIKLTISNQIYELSRIQFLLQSLFSSSTIQKSHQIGIPLSLNFSDESDYSEQRICNNDQGIQSKQNQIVPNLIINANDKIKVIDSNSMKIPNLIENNDQSPDCHVNQQINLNKEIISSIALHDGDYILLIKQEEDILQSYNVVVHQQDLIKQEENNSSCPINQIQDIT